MTPTNAAETADKAALSARAPRSASTERAPRSTQRKQGVKVTQVTSRPASVPASSGGNTLGAR